MIILILKMPINLLNLEKKHLRPFAFVCGQIFPKNPARSIPFGQTLAERNQGLFVAECTGLGDHG